MPPKRTDMPPICSSGPPSAPVVPAAEGDVCVTPAIASFARAFVVRASRGILPSFHQSKPSNKASIVPIIAGTAPTMAAMIRLASSIQREFRGAAGVDAGRIEEGRRCVAVADEQHDLGAAQNDGLRAALDQAAHDPPIFLA